MDEMVKEELQGILELLRNCMVTNSVSMATDQDGNIYFFDTDTYINELKMSGFTVNIKELVK